MMSDTKNENRRKDDARPDGALTWTDPAPAAAHLGDVMIDIETMGTTPGSAILSISAVMFGPSGLGETFYAPIALASCTAAGLTIDPYTVAWWMKQSDAARAAAFRDDAEPLAAVLQQFTCWLELVDAEKPWCQGANFDAPLLDAAYRACGMASPWKFWNVRDTRTLYELADVKVDRARGVHHNALDDARAQAEAAVVALQRLQDARRPAIGRHDATCTCPSGDGSLRWPCPAHPPESASGSDGTAAAGADALYAALQAAGHALRSYQYGNSSPDLAAQTADGIDALLSDRAAATSGSELADRSVLDIAARIFDFKPHKQTEEVKAKYLRFADEVIAQQAGAPTVSVKDALRRCGADTDYHGKMVFTVPQFEHFVSLITAPAPAAEEVRWSKEPPTEQADYWHWDGDEDHAPMIYHVLWSGTAKKCFVSIGQYGIDEAIWCDNFGGYWMKIEQPSVRAAMSASQGKTEEAK